MGNGGGDGVRFLFSPRTTEGGETKSSKLSREAETEDCVEHN